MKTHYEVIIIWAGPAGLWIGKKLQEIWVNYSILEKNSIGSTFTSWNPNTHFLTPSFPSNDFGQVDLNSIDASSSPGFSAQTEHLDGTQYSEYLQNFSQTHNLNVMEYETVISIEKQGHNFSVQTQKNCFQARYVCIATWEHSFPDDGWISGAKQGIHSSRIDDYSMFDGSSDTVPIIGWYESAIDVAYNLYKRWKKVHLFSGEKINSQESSDPSVSLSVYSIQKYRELKESQNYQHTALKISKIQYKHEKYSIIWEGETFYFAHQPILATWFSHGLDTLLKNTDRSKKYDLSLNQFDELKSMTNMFIIWPKVRHDDTIYCFIYKFRSRFWIVALEIAKRLWKDIDYQKYKNLWERQWFHREE